MKKITLQMMLSAYRIYFGLLFLVQPKLGAKKAVKVFATPFTKKVRAKEKEILAKATMETYSYQGLPIRLYRWGEGAKTALLVHGWEANAGSLGAFVEPLVAKGFQVLAFDGPAHGSSGGKQTTLFQFAGLVAELIQEHSPEVLISHSFGSGSSIYALYSNKQLSVRKMIMLTTPNRMDEIFSDFTRLMKISDQGKEGIYDYLHSRFGKRVDEMDVSSMAPECNIEELLIIHSPSDKVLPFHCAEQVAAKLPRAILEAPINKGHYRILWDPATVERVNQFIHE